MGRQTKTAIDRWLCVGCGREVGFLMRNEITVELAHRNRAGERVRLCAQVYASAGANFAACVVKARFANALNGKMCSEQEMLDRPNPIGYTKDWVMEVTRLTVHEDNHLDANWWCVSIRVDEEEGEVMDVQVLGVKTGINDVFVNVPQQQQQQQQQQQHHQQQDEEEEEEEEEAVNMVEEQVVNAFLADGILEELLQDPDIIRMMTDAFGSSDREGMMHEHAVIHDEIMDGRVAGESMEIYRV